jgi:hypothetical protein
MPWLNRLKSLREDFQCTLFCVPALGDDEYWESLPDWVEVAMHGWAHPTPREAEHWSYDQSVDVLLSKPNRFVDGWKSPGWLTSPGMYQALGDLGWWIADQHLADDVRPAGLPVYLWEDGHNWHGHVQNLGTNGLEETWDIVRQLVIDADEFRFASDAVAVTA